MAANPTDEAVAELERDWPLWQIWVVHRYIGGPGWGARRWDGTGRGLKAGCPEDPGGDLGDGAAR